ncbi:hypothetical protein SLEP1_g22622 [Rubroshorea leprosula]|uniref:Uncharacterized protein n=1 Tax=Rubroshorea leprosula TaxID=152421 RepID=A0AAV5JJ11_9ROSI|nr:hypothetical protein SLEP1_g22622 [Rubroshorea leprosula]
MPPKGHFKKDPPWGFVGSSEVKTRAEEGSLVWSGNQAQPLGQGQGHLPNNLPPHLPPQIPNLFPLVEHAEGGDENQPHNSAHNLASTANHGDVVTAQLAAMQQQFNVFQLVLAQLLAWNNPGDPLINLLNPTQQPPVQQQDPQLVQHAPALNESQGLQHERFKDSLIKHPAATFNEVNDRSLKFITAEDYALSQKPVLPKNQNPDWRDEGQSKKQIRTVHSRGQEKDGFEVTRADEKFCYYT